MTIKISTFVDTKWLSPAPPIRTTWQHFTWWTGSEKVWWIAMILKSCMTAWDFFAVRKSTNGCWICLAFIQEETSTKENLLTLFNIMANKGHNKPTCESDMNKSEWVSWIGFGVFWHCFLSLSCQTREHLWSTGLWCTSQMGRHVSGQQDIFTLTCM